MREFIIPPRAIETPDSPVVFLAGPVQGTFDWQEKAAEHLIASGLHMDVVSPRGDPDLYKKPSTWLDDNKQTPWEKYHLRLARDQGCLAMWMAAQDYETPGRVFAQTSRIEFGRIAGWMDYNPDIRFVFGIDPSYAGGNRTYFEEVCAEFDLTVHATTGSWCDDIVNQIAQTP